MSCAASLLLAACGGDGGASSDQGESPNPPTPPEPNPLVLNDISWSLNNTDQHSYTLKCRDSDTDDVCSFSISSAPQHGTASISGDELLYTITPGSHYDEFEIVATDTNGASDSAIIEITYIEKSYNSSAVPIGNCTELQNIGISGNYALSNDIDCSQTVTWNDGRGFNPIGGESAGTFFSGTIEGNGYKVTNLYINRPSAVVGLIGVATTCAQIRNLGLENVEITGSPNIAGAGAVAGIADLTEISNVYSTGQVTGRSSVGGLVGASSRTIVSNSYSTAGISSNSTSAANIVLGGLVGVNSTGLIPLPSAPCPAPSPNQLEANWIDGIYNSYSAGPVTGSGSFIGGLVGSNFGTIEDSYWDIQTSGQSSSDGGNGKSTSEMKSETTYAGWDFTNLWIIEEGNSYPHF
ncbi:MAG: hypothetical protein IT489_09495 [Gammaproteobacteria bacterium]|nr:hypothetical protein [Gammaproteobacteria bacterium]